MIIDKVSAAAFGPLRSETLELAPGMTVIHGLNESGKSTWHAAIFAALCGIRRTKGRQQVDDREFRERHKPWQGSAWRVGAILRLGDGRRIEMRQDLGDRVDCRATDLDLGRDCSSEIMSDGAPDASVWLGLDRRTFPAIACVRQTEILEVKSPAGALQNHIQRAADTAGVDHTAAAALARLDEFRASRTGLVRANSNRPLPSAMRVVDAARTGLAQAQQQHTSYLGLVATAERLQSQARIAENRFQLFRAAVMRHQADVAQSRLDRILQLQRLLPDGEPPRLAADDELAQQVSAALEAWSQRPAPPALEGDSAEALRVQIEQLPIEPTGDTAPTRPIIDAQAQVADLDKRMADHVIGMPAPRVADTSAASIDGSEARATGRPTAALSPLVLIPALAGVLLGVVLLGLGAPIVGVAMIVAALGALGGLWLLRSRQTAAETLAQAGPSPEPVQDERLREWQTQTADLDRMRNVALQALADALRSRGMTVDANSRDHIQSAYELYLRQCEERRSAAAQAARRQDLEARLRLRQQTEQAAILANEQIARAGDTLRNTAARCSLQAPTIPELETRLRAWLRDRSLRLEDEQKLRAAWAELQTLLDGHTPEDLEADVRGLRVQAQKLSDGMSGSIELEADSESQGEELERLAAEARRTAHEAAGMVEERQKSVPDVARAEEDLARAEAELARLRRLDGILERTQEFLTRAQDRVHRSIAPVLASSLETWLPQLTAGRYHEVHVDPETLEVKVAVGAGQLRSAHLLSHGTAEQTYLLLRATLAEHLTVGGEVCPLILDDVTVHCDSERQRALLCTLHQLSAARQVVVFTQEDNVLCWAQQEFTTARDRVICLPPPKPLVA